MCETIAQPEYYVIRVRGHLEPRWAEWFSGLTLTHTEAGETILAGPVADQAALHGLLVRIRDLNLTLVSVARVEPDQ
jgi:hypothetical protein